MLAASHVLHHPAPEQGRDAEQERDPEPIPEHRHVVPLVAIVRAGRALNGVSDRPMWPRAFAGHVDRGRQRVMVLVRVGFWREPVHFVGSVNVNAKSMPRDASELMMYLIR